MRLSEFWRLVEDEFTPGYARSLVAEQHLTDLGGVTGEVALERGDDPKLVWLTLCEHMGVPESRRLGVDRAARKGRR